MPSNLKNINVYLIILFFFLFSCTSVKRAQKPRIPAVSTEKIKTGAVIHVPHSNVSYVSMNINQLPDWNRQNFSLALKAFKQSCKKIGSYPGWNAVCSSAQSIDNNNTTSAKLFFEKNFTPWMIKTKDGSAIGKFTGYYEPAILGSKTKTNLAKYPIYGIPDDFISVPLSEEFKKNRRVVNIKITGKNRGAIHHQGNYQANLNKFPILDTTRSIKGRIQGNSFIPYYTRAQINSGAIKNKAPIIGYANDPIELFFLQVQGSGRILTPNGTYIKLAYADKNEHPYQSIGTYMAKMGYLDISQTNMQKIKNFLVQNPNKLSEILSQNPSFIFFQENSSTQKDYGPVGSLGVPLTAEYSAAVDRRYIQLGSPLFISTIDPRDQNKLNRIIMAQDTGSAIVGGIRVDFFWGFGETAGQVAGKMHHPGNVWILLPHHLLPKYQK